MNRAKAERELRVLAPVITALLRENPDCGVEFAAVRLQRRGLKTPVVHTIFDVRDDGSPYLVRNRSTAERVTLVMRYDEDKFVLLEVRAVGEPSGAAGSFYV